MPKFKILFLFSLVTLILGSARPARAMPTSRQVQAITNWVQVNDSAFDLGAGADGLFTGEEAKEMLVFHDRLYLGMEADNSLGARLWRTREGVTSPSSQTDWEEVAADSHGYPFGNTDLVQNDHIDSLMSFGNYLYVSTGNRGNGGLDPAGTLLYRSQTGDADSWGSPLALPGFGDPNNENFKDMIVFQGWLCGGTWNQVTGAQVWCSQDGVTWQQKNTGGFGADANQPANMIMVHSFVFENHLYIGLENSGADGIRNSDDIAKIFRTADISAANPTWEQVYSGSTGSLNADLLGELNSYLYIATASTQGIVILRSDSGDIESWVQVNTDGMTGNLHNTHTYNDSSLVIEGHLYVAINNSVEGFEVWRTAGIAQENNNLVDWEQFGPNGWSDTNNIHAGLVAFNGQVYAWTTNYVSGQQVRRSASLDIFHVYLPLTEQTGH
jgi:hypothetical protein